MRRRELPAIGDWVLDGRGPMTNPISHSREDEVLDALDAMAPEDSALLRMRHYEQLTYAEIGDEFGWTRQLAHYHVGQAEKRMKERLENEDS